MTFKKFQMIMFSFFTLLGSSFAFSQNELPPTCYGTPNWCYICKSAKTETVKLEPPSMWKETTVDVFTDCRSVDGTNYRDSIAIGHCSFGKPGSSVICSTIVNKEKFPHFYAPKGNAWQYKWYEFLAVINDPNYSVGQDLNISFFVKIRK